MTDVTEGSRGH